MATTEPATSEGAARRVVLIDFDWQDADLMPELLRQLDISVRLVAGTHEDDAGVRVAELCGVPRTVELADLTREIFDLALVGARSTRRVQVERLLSAIGTPVASPQSFLASTQPATVGAPGPGWSDPAPLGILSIPGRDLDDMLAEALPDFAPREGPRVGPSPTPLDSPRPAGPLDPSDRSEYERMLAGWAEETRSRTAELHLGTSTSVDRVCRIGGPDPLLDALVRLAIEQELPQVVTRVDGPDRGMTWGAWPFHSTRHRGVLAAAAIDTSHGCSVWEHALVSLREAWRRRETRASASGPAGSNARPQWTGIEAFRSRLQQAITAHREGGARYAVHRIRFGGPIECVDTLCRQLPDQVRESDVVAHPTPRDVLFLAGGAAESFAQVRRRVVALWEQAWRDAGQPSPAPTLVDERVELMSSEDARAFLDVSSRWLDGA